jgi:hypothetical protein
MFNLRLFFYFSGMNQSPETNFFEIKLSSQGADYLFRLYKGNRWLFILLISLSVLLLGNSVIRYVLFQHYNQPGWLAFVQAKIIPVYTVILAVINVVMVYYYFHFSRICKKSIEQQQTDLFNSSFKWLLRYTSIACVVLVLQIIFYMFDLFTAYSVLQKITR